MDRLGFALLFAGLLAACGGNERQRPPGTNPRPPVCAPATCSGLQLDCGAVADGCGGTLSCGTCGADQSCGGAGVPNRCGEGTCTPKTCGELGAGCGEISDGCAAVLDCGGCAAPATCGGGGVANQCGEGCTPTTCSAVGASCGSVPDGCGGELSCGTCTAPETCGGGGVPNQCGSGCTPMSCADAMAECGTVPDGCGGSLDCGGCAAPETCGGAGVPNQCGTPCMPQTCMQLGAECGEIDDGCGTTLMCGMCTEPLTCGGGGVANQCGATCNTPCPTGYSCDAFGVCAGGNASMLDPNVLFPPAITVSGVLRANGAAPTLEAGQTDACVRISFQTLDGLESDSDWACASAGWAYSIDIFAGDFRIVVDNTGGTTMPRASFEVAASHTFTGSGTHDVRVTHPPPITVSGLLRANGGAPGLEPGQTDACVRVSFQTLDGLESDSDWACASAGWTYSIGLFAGDFRIVVDNTSGTTMPRASFEVSASRTFNGSGSYNVDVTFPPPITVSGLLRANGGAPGLEAGQTDACVRVSFQTLDGLESDSDWACASAGWTYSIGLFAGDFRIVVDNTSGTTMPRASFEVSASRTFNASASHNVNVAFPPPITVSGLLRANGAAPALEPGQTDACVRVSFQTLDDLESDSDWACASAGWAYSIGLFAGDFRIVVDNTSGTTMPRATFEVSAAQTFNGSMTFHVDVTHPPPITVSGVLRANGLPPTLEAGQTDACVRVSLQTLDGLESDSDWACASAGWSYSIGVFAGDFRVVVDNTSGTTMPQVSFEIAATRTFGSSATYTVDVLHPPPITVSGTLLANGLVPQLAAGQTDACVRVSLQSLDGLESDSDWACFSGGWAYSIGVFAGEFRIVVDNTSGTTMPSSSFEVVERIRLP